VLNFYRDKCLDIIKLLDTFSIKHIPREENNWANRLAQQASGFIVSQGVFWIASVSLVEHRYALRSRGRPILEDSDRLRDKEKPILGNTKRSPANTDWLSGKIELELGRTELEPGKTEPSSGKEKLVLGNTNQLPGNEDQLLGKADPGIEPSSGKVEPGPSYRCGLREESEPIQVKKTMKNRLLRRASPRTLGHP
jgi:hypothetical protein